MDYVSVIEFADGVLSRKDPYNHHGANVAGICLRMAAGLSGGLGAEELSLLHYSARLHDVGKIFLDDMLLNYPRRLTLGEYARMKTHVHLGHELSVFLEYDPRICETILCHHEHFDGSGYPRGLKGAEIPLFARIVTLADVWDSITNDRAYRPAMPFEQAMREMSIHAAWFDPKLYEIWLDLARHYDNQ